MADLKRNNLYSQMVRTSSALGDVKLPNINMGTPQTSFSGSSTSGLENLGTVTTPYMGNTKIESSHPGVDIANNIGTVIPSYTEGTVVEKQTGKVQDMSTPSFGNYILVKTPDGKFVRYSHLSDSWVNVGDTVKKDEPIARMGNSGSTYSNSGGSGSHLDLRIYELYQNQKKYLNPLEYLKNT